MNGKHRSVRLLPKGPTPIKAGHLFKQIERKQSLAAFVVKDVNGIKIRVKGHCRIERGRGPFDIPTSPL